MRAAERDAVRQGRHQRLRRRTARRRREPGAHRHEGGRADYRLTVAGRRVGRRAPAAVAEPRRRRRSHRSATVRRRAVPSAQRRGRRVLRVDHARVGRRPTTASVMRQALAGMLWSKQYYYFDLDRWLDEHGAHPLRPRPAPTCATSSGSTWSTTTSSRCRTSGSTRGTRRGTSRSTPSPLAHGRPRLRQGAARADAARAATCTRAARCRPTSGTSATSTRRCTPGPRCSSTLVRRRTRGAGDVDVPAARVPEAAAELHLVGEPQGPERHATCSRAASSASTTSACSTAARRCRPAATSSRPTARPGWRFLPEHARDRARAGRARPELRGPGRSSSSSTSSGSPRRWTASARTTTRCGTRRTASSTTCCACPTAAPRASRCARWSGCCRSAPRRSFEPTVIEQLPGARRRGCAGSSRATPTCSPTSPTRTGRASRGRRLLSLLDEHKLRRVLARHARRGRVPRPARHPLAVPLPPRPSVRRSTCDGQRVPGRLPAGRVRHRHVRRQLELARPGLVARSTPAASARCCTLPLLRRRLHGRVPDRLRQA